MLEPQRHRDATGVFLNPAHGHAPILEPCTEVQQASIREIVQDDKAGVGFGRQEGFNKGFNLGRWQIRRKFQYSELIALSIRVSTSVFLTSTLPHS